MNLTVANTKGAKGLPLRSLLLVPGRPLYERNLDELDADGLFATANDDGRHTDFRIPPEAQTAPPVKLWRRMRRAVTRSAPEPPAALVPASDHPETLAVRYEVAVEQAKDGDFAGAVRLLEELVADQDRVAGANHHDSLVMRGTLADFRGARAMRRVPSPA